MVRDARRDALPTSRRPKSLAPPFRGLGAGQGGKSVNFTYPVLPENSEREVDNGENLASDEQETEAGKRATEPRGSAIRPNRYNQGEVPHTAGVPQGESAAMGISARNEQAAESGADIVEDISAGDAQNEADVDEVEDVENAELGQPERCGIDKRNEVERPRLSLVKPTVPPVNSTSEMPVSPIPPIIPKVEQAGGTDKWDNAERPTGTMWNGQPEQGGTETRWQVEWRTTSKNTRPMIARLYWRDGGRWRPVTREMVDTGKIQFDGVLTFSVKKFTIAEAEKIERIDGVKQRFNQIINAGSLRRTA